MRGSRAGIAQLVEHDLAKVGVASSSLVSRSRFLPGPRFAGVLFFRRIALQETRARDVSRYRPGGRVVMQRPAKPRTPVRFRPRPPRSRNPTRPCGLRSVGQSMGLDQWRLRHQPACYEPEPVRSCVTCGPSIERPMRVKSGQPWRTGHQQCAYFPLVCLLQQAVLANPVAAMTNPSPIPSAATMPKTRSTPNTSKVASQRRHHPSPGTTSRRTTKADIDPSDAQKKGHPSRWPFSCYLVGETGFEPTTSTSRT